MPSTLTYKNDPTIGWIGPLIPYLDPLMRDRGGFKVAQLVYDDWQVEACFGQLVGAVNSFELEFRTTGTRRKDQKALEWLKELVNSPNYKINELSRQAMLAILFGFGAAEAQLVTDGQYRTLDLSVPGAVGGFKFWNHEYLRFKADGTPRFLTWKNMAEGEECKPFSLLELRYGSLYCHDWHGRGKWRWCYWPVLFKRQGIREWMKFLEEFARPSPIVKYPPNATQAEQDKATEIAQLIKAGVGGSAPQGWEIELLQASRSGTGDYSELDSRMDAAIAKVLLGQTLSSADGSGGYALGKVHMGVGLQQIKDAADWLFESLNGYWARLIRYNFGDDVAIPQVWRRIEAEPDPIATAEVMVKLHGIGYRANAQKIETEFGSDFTDLNPPPDPNAPQEKPPLVQSLGVGGTQSLVDFLQSLPTLGLPRQNAINTLVVVFGIDPEAAASIVPDYPTPNSEPPTPNSPENPTSDTGSASTSDPQSENGQSITETPAPVTGDFNDDLEEVDEEPEEEPDPEFAAAPNPGDRVVNPLTDRLLNETRPQTRDWFDLLFSKFEEIGDYAAFQQYLETDAFADLKGDALARSMAQALAVARLAGAVDVGEESGEG